MTASVKCTLVQILRYQGLKQAKLCNDFDKYLCYMTQSNKMAATHATSDFSVIRQPTSNSAAAVFEGCGCQVWLHSESCTVSLCSYMLPSLADPETLPDGAPCDSIQGLLELQEVQAAHAVSPVRQTHRLQAFGRTALRLQP